MISNSLGAISELSGLFLSAFGLGWALGAILRATRRIFRVGVGFSD